MQPGARMAHAAEHRCGRAAMRKKRQRNRSSLHTGGIVEPVVAGSSTAGRAFKGTAHAVYECLERLDALDWQLVAVFAADHLYCRDVRRWRPSTRPCGRTPLSPPCPRH